VIIFNLNKYLEEYFHTLQQQRDLKSK